jgi:cytidylate kinase
MFEKHDEHKSFLRSFLHIPNGLANSGYQQSANFSQDAFFKFQSDAIMRAADEGNCVFVGRCADYVLRNRIDTVNIFITAKIEFRISQVMAKQGFKDREEALRFIEQGESQRAAYYKFYTGKKWGHSESYDLCIDSSVLGLMETEKLLAAFIRKRFDL